MTPLKISPFWVVLLTVGASALTVVGGGLLRTPHRVGPRPRADLSMITPIFKDLKTGATAPGDPASIFWWTEGNGSCDCNRACFLGKDEEMEAAMRLAHPDLLPLQSYFWCWGCKRFIAVDVTGDFEGMTKEAVLKALNEGYPADIEGKHGG